ncbi:MAG TPA: hypothetical protein VLI90_17605 [Tepidisphaeraceae bacterium]|nr:hypothetical protein [Tepidisphaeraceae bacterium]
MGKARLVLLALILLASSSSGAADAPWQQLGGGSAFGNWPGLKVAADGTASLAVPGEAVFRYPDGPRGFYKHGFRVFNDGTADWHADWGVQLEVKLADARAVELMVSIAPASRGNEVESRKATVRIAGDGWHTVNLPWSAFQFEQADFAFLRFIKQLSIAAAATDANQAPFNISLRNVRVVKAPSVAMESDVLGKAAPKNQAVEYPIVVSNCTDQPQAVALSLVRYGWETMDSVIEPAAVQLAPWASQACTLRVSIGDRVPPGGHEQQVVQAIANGDSAASSRLTFITTSELPHPYIMHTPARWDAVREKVKRYAWAKAAQDAYVEQAEKWRVPEVAQPPGNDPDDTMGPFLFRTQNENDLLACAYSWQLSGNRAHAEKVAEFLRRLSNPQNGYPVTLRGCNQSLVQEGHFFQHIAMAYDMIHDAGVLSPADRAQIESTFGIFIETIERESERGAINNWNLSEDCGAFYCALAMQDLSLADRFFSGPAGIKDQLAKGTMDDGWWYECSISYNMWCASEFTQAALAYEPFGVNFKDMHVPASYSPKVMLTSRLSGGNMPDVADPDQRRKPFGMNPDVFGPTRRPYRTITDLWNGLLPFVDYRGVMFGVNDSTESQVAGNRTEVSGQPFEIAYSVYRDPKYAAMIKMGGGGKRDLLYAVPDLPEQTPELFRDNASADNVGLVMLRSQTPNRPMRDQIQAALHYGTHGWAHGHFDRTNLIALMRNGRNFWNPESVFWVYEPFMYKFYCQTSLNQNMVVVDEKMQEAAPGERLMLYSGRAMQATAVQTTARWSNPPHGGMVYDYVPVKSFAEKCWREGRSVPIPENPPAYGTLTGFTETIHQRRLMIVTDDYVVLADDIAGDQPHTFESLLQLKGFLGIEAPQKQFLRHDAQWNADPVGSAQFVTDCNWYSAQAPAVARFEERWGPGADNEGSRSAGNEDGVMKLDVHSLWPPAQQIMVATAPEQHDTEKRLFYSVRGDGRTLAGGKFGAWILGRGDIDVPVDGIKQLELETKTELSRHPTLFWAAAGIVTRDGKEIPLSQLPMQADNIVPTKGPDQDYLGGPVKIIGEQYKQTIAAEPKDAKQPGVIRVDLTGTDAVRFKAVIGSDYPPGDESQRRKVYAIRPADARAATARFITIIEPYEDRPTIKSATATSGDHLRVELTDGRVQEIALHNLAASESGPSADLTETRDGQVLRRESTTSGN